MIFSKDSTQLRLSLVSITYATLLAFNCIDTAYAAAIPRSRVINIVNENLISHKVSGVHGAVSVENEQCSNTGANVLKEGGSAVDAAIASTLCIGAINSFGSGFMLIRTASGEYDFIDFREAAPAAATEDMYVHNLTLSQASGLSVSIPGEIRGFELAHSKYGKLPWSRLFNAVSIARDGFVTTGPVHHRLELSEKWLIKLPEWSELFAPNGTIAEVGSIIKRLALADTLTLIANEGANAFYEGAIAESIVNTVVREGGILTLEDLKNYRAIERPVISTTYHGHRVLTTSAPTSGPVVLNVLNLAFKFGYAGRTEIGDPDFNRNEDRLDDIITKEWANSIRYGITDNETHNISYYNPKYESSNPHGTMHLSVVASDNSAVALTSTINLNFGSKIMDKTTGIILNDQQADFSSPGSVNAFGYSPSRSNFIAPGNRPLSTTTPTMIENEHGELMMVLGGSGGSKIVSTTLNAIINTLDFKQDLFDAVGSPRLHHQLMPNKLGAETGFDPIILADLAQRGHEIYELDVNVDILSAVQAIYRHTNGTLDAVSDPRKFGLAAAY